MSHGIVEINRDFVYGLAGQGKDWHGLTIEKNRLNVECFPTLRPESLYLATGATPSATPWQVLVADDDNKPCGKPFDPDTFGFITPQNAWEHVMEALDGTRFSVERVGMLWDRSFWFVSVSLDELKTLARPGEHFQLNFSGGLDGSKSPQAELSHIRAVCHNTISLSRATGKCLFKIKQSKFSQGRLDKATAEVEQACGMAEVFNRTLASLESKPCSSADARALFAGEVIQHGGGFARTVTKLGNVRESKNLNAVDSLVALFNRGAGNKGETRADALNAFTQRLTRGGNDDGKSQKNPWTAVASSEFATAANRKAEFLNIVTDDDKTAATIEIGRKALSEINA